MQPFPHHYAVSARGQQLGSVYVEASGVDALETNPPVDFGGPGGYWTPEDLLVGAVANCFIFTFRAVATASGFEWVSLSCEANGTLDKEGRQIQFTGIALKATLTVAAGTDEEKAKRLMERAEQACLVTNSLKCPVTLESTVVAA